MGFLDLNGGCGRHFGSLGLSLASPSIDIDLRPAREVCAVGPMAERAAQFAGMLLDEFNPSVGVNIELKHGIPAHAGLGSGTQLALALGRGLSDLYGLKLNYRDIAIKLGRGARSGIGIGAFEIGGFLVDGGHTAVDSVAPIIARMEFPEQWRIILVHDFTKEGLHGDDEKEAFSKLPPMSEDFVGQMCRTLVMCVLPALAENDISEFGAAITQIQNCIGDHFEPVQGGRYYSLAVAERLNWMLSNGAAGVGQSSWGPTGFAVCENRADAQKVVDSMQKNIRLDDKIEYQIVKATNRGSEVTINSLTNHDVEVG